MIVDAQGNRLAGASSSSITHYNNGLRAFTLAYGVPLTHFDSALAESPDFLMVHAAKAWLMWLASDPSMVQAARPCLAAVNGPTAGPIERGHYTILSFVLNGELGQAAGAIDTHCVAHPHDLLALYMGVYVDYFQGRARSLRDRPARALKQWSPQLPGYPTLLALHAFGLQETGDYVRAEAAGREAAAREPHDIFAHHSVSHVMEMQGRPEDGVGWMISRERYWASPDNPGRAHLWFHRALFHMDLGETEAAMALYDSDLLPSVRPLGFSLTNPTAVLWRLGLMGCDVSQRARALAQSWAGHADGATCPFADLHAVAAELMAGDDAAVELRIAALKKVAAGRGQTAESQRDVGLPLAEGFSAFHREDYARAAELLFPTRLIAHRFGGSHAQRDIIDWTLAEASIRGRQKNLALALAHERMALKPHSFPNREFLRRAEAL